MLAAVFVFFRFILIFFLSVGDNVSDVGGEGLGNGGDLLFILVLFRLLVLMFLRFPVFILILLLLVFLLTTISLHP